MVKEIKRSYWTKFLKNFNTNNQYRQMTINVKINNVKRVIPLCEDPFLGLVIEKQGRLIDGIQFWAGKGDSDSVVEPVLTIKQPEKITLEKNKDGFDWRMTVKSKDGSIARMEMGEKAMNMPGYFIEKVAYSIYEHRGHNHGSDISDWLEAKKRVREAELMFVE